MTDEKKDDLGETNEDELRCSEGFFDWTFAEIFDRM